MGTPIYPLKEQIINARAIAGVISACNKDTNRNEALRHVWLAYTLKDERPIAYCTDEHRLYMAQAYDGATVARSDEELVVPFPLAKFIVSRITGHGAQPFVDCKLTYTGKAGAGRVRADIDDYSYTVDWPELEPVNFRRVVPQAEKFAPVAVIGFNPAYLADMVKASRAYTGGGVQMMRLNFVSDSNASLCTIDTPEGWWAGVLMPMRLDDKYKVEGK